MRNLKSFLLLPALCLVAASCKNKSVNSAQYDDMPSPQAILAEMRADKDWIHTLDSLAAIHIGPGARCLDPVKHLFVCNNHYWLYNQDWGGVVELPEGYVPEDDATQAILSFHGTRVWNPDTTVLMSVYAGLQSIPEYELESTYTEMLTEDSLTITGISRLPFYCDGDSCGSELRLTTLNSTGVAGIFRYITYNGPVHVSYNISLQYAREDSLKVLPLIGMMNRYPFGPDDQLPVGECWK